ncbi:MAG: hypothetical protein NDJ89_14250 [Oligoflexia bacterium]|nr:hypothetical protein [Oligoflexia bacterium]
MLISAFLAMNSVSLSLASADLGVLAGPPRPINPGLSYSELMSVYESGSKTSESMLEGHWKSVAIYNSAACKMATEGTDWSGLKNEDSSISGLTFGYVSRNVPGSNPILKVFSVTGTSLGNKDTFQGPYQVDGVEPQFAFWAYRSSGGEYHEAYFEKSCRFVQGNADQLVCASGFKLLASLGEPAKSCAAAPLSHIELYVKSPQ